MVNDYHSQETMLSSPDSLRREAHNVFCIFLSYITNNFPFSRSTTRELLRFTDRQERAQQKIENGMAIGAEYALKEQRNNTCIKDQGSTIMTLLLN